MLDSDKENLKLEAMKYLVGVRGEGGVCWWVGLRGSGRDVDGHGVIRTCCVVLDSSSQMVAKGKDCAALFPAVVKNVISTNPEV